MIVLASASTARRKLIKICKKNISFAYSDIDETRKNKEELYDYLQRVTYLKAFGFVSSKKTVIAVDTVVVFRDKIIGKPKNRQEAFDILTNLKGNYHYCFSAVTILSDKAYEFFVDYAVVYMNYVNDKQIDDYLSVEDFTKRAAGYAVQGRASAFMEVVKGDVTTVIGLPMKRLCRII